MVQVLFKNNWWTNTARRFIPWPGVAVEVQAITAKFAP